MSNEIDAFIQSDPDIMMGKPVIRGTRITVELILEKVAAGESIEQIQQEHPHISTEQIRTALKYAALVFKSDVVHLVGV
ncbi:MAG: DUF433 domain-containing protein [Spirochaeta sp.]|jgi:uncharacterized protein (DUF433 family)|nr:DUF433 domain-containing protein [Spirochaeta sp.]